MQRRILLLAVASLGLGACSLPSMGAPSPASEQGSEIYDLYRWYTAIAAGVGVFVTVLLVYVVLRYRRRDDVIPSQKQYNVPIEVVYTVIPLLIVAGLFAFSVRTEDRVNATVDEPDLVVDVTGFQWQWQFSYPDSGIVVTGTPAGGVPELVLPAERTSRLNLVTTDVNHNFWVPQFLNKRDLIPGVDNAIDITPTETGTYDGYCAEFCGLDHGRMRFDVTVMEPDDFDAWVEETAP
jgi:cytochrome c oxidase subunit 2